jgi:predicted CXXCH cytochrome family protein
MRRSGSIRLALIAALAVALCLGIVGWGLIRSSSPSAPPSVNVAIPRKVSGGKHLSVWWDGIPADIQKQSTLTGQTSNIHPTDYTGPSECRKCHKANYDSWSGHPHSVMNALATPAMVKGDFSDTAAISYRGGRATFQRVGDSYRMHLERDAVRRTYEITQTIGSRYFQYYVGKLTEGPEPTDHHFYKKDHVLGFGYWLSQMEWVPVVHIGPETPDRRRMDPFAPPASGRHYAEYAAGCNYCHTTFPLADMFGRIADNMGEHAPVDLHWSLRDYLEGARPRMIDRISELMDRSLGPTLAEMPDRNMVSSPMADWEASQYAVTLGVSCEACHLGGKEHVESAGKIPPRFFPNSPHLFVQGTSPPPDSGRTHHNVNWACGRCHTGRRPQFAAGMSTWNSVEYADAMRGGCYSQLRCIDCHNPHKATGTKWQKTPEQDDAVCLKCHEKFRSDDNRQGHTHHASGSAGARCLNCHMPRINEGLEDAVRTHMIYSPTRPDMIEAGQPNACNLCHTSQPIRWTLDHLNKWYGATFNEEKIASNYLHKNEPAALGWLRSEHSATRLVAAEALTKRGDRWAIPQLVEALDDPYLLNRQFASKGLQEMLGMRLPDLGYRFYMTREERRSPLEKIRARLLSPALVQPP